MSCSRLSDLSVYVMQVLINFGIFRMNPLQRLNCLHLNKDDARLVIYKHGENSGGK